MTADTATRPSSIRERFAFVDDVVHPAGDFELRSRLVHVHEVKTGVERTLRLWRKTRTPADNDLRALWRHESRHVQRVMSYAGARDVIVEAVEFVEDEDYFGIVLARTGQPLSQVLRDASPRYWMRRLEEPGPRTLLWQNVRRLGAALGILHAQGLIHGNVTPYVVMTDGFEDPDFRLTGFEWSIWLGGEPSRNTKADKSTSSIYSFEGDWKALGHLVAWALGAALTEAGDVSITPDSVEVPVFSHGERQLLRRLVAPAPTESLDSASITRAIDDLIASLARSRTTGAAALLLLTFASWEKVGQAIYDASDHDIPTDNVDAQIRWMQADLDAGATLLVPRDFDAAHSSLRVVTTNMVYELAAFRDQRTMVPTWEVAVCRNVRTRAAALPVANEAEHNLDQAITVVRRFAEADAIRGRRAADVLDWSAFASPRPAEASKSAGEVRRALLLAQTLEALMRTLENYPVEIARTDQELHVFVRAQDQSERDSFAKTIGLGTTADALRRLFEEDQRDATVAWRLGRSPNLGASRARDAQAQFIAVSADGSAYEFKVDRNVEPGRAYFLRAERELGTEQVIRRRLRNLAALESHIDLSRALEDPWRERRSSPERLELGDALADLDEPKRIALRAIFETLPSFFVVGPPGVGKTKLATEVTRHCLVTEPSTRMLVTAQGHDALSHLQTELKKMLQTAGLSGSLLVRSKASEGRQSTDDDLDVVAQRTLSALAASELARAAPASLRSRIGPRSVPVGGAGQDSTLLSGDNAARQHALESLLIDAAHIFLSTANSNDIARLVESREQFDWVLIEEAAKATGPELVGPLLLSGRRLSIGDHHQLAPMEADRVARILKEPSLVSAALALAKRHLAPVFGDAPELDDLIALLADPEALTVTAARALSLLEPFRAFVEEDERRAKGKSNHRPVSATLTQQRRMDPAIARIVSQAFYDGRLTTEPGRIRSASTDPLPYDVRSPMPHSPVVVIDFPHVSSTGRSEPAEDHRPRWSNRQEVEAVIDVLCRVRPRTAGVASLAVLSPYAAQVARISQRMRVLRNGPLAHLRQFASVRSDGELVGTVDSFQGSEADLVILSLVRNNARAGVGALGFLRDRRRINVALSRAKAQLVIVGSLSFLEEAVRGTYPRDDVHELSFLTSIVSTIRALAAERRTDGVPLATILSPDGLRRRA